MKTTDQLIPAYATHPGSILLDEIVANGYSQIEFAKLIDINRSQLNEIIKGKRGIHANLALALEKTLKIDANYWLEAQKNYELDMARLEAKNIQLLQKIDMKLMKNEL